MPWRKRLGANVFFVWLGNVVAWLGLIFGGFRLGIGIYIAAQNDAAVRTAMSVRYLGSSSSGEAIDQAIPVIAAAVALGVLVKIASTLRRILYLAETE